MQGLPINYGRRTGSSAGGIGVGLPTDLRTVRIQEYLPLIPKTVRFGLTGVVIWISWSPAFVHGQGIGPAPLIVAGLAVAIQIHRINYIHDVIIRIFTIPAFIIYQVIDMWIGWIRYRTNIVIINPGNVKVFNDIITDVFYFIFVDNKIIVIAHAPGQPAFAHLYAHGYMAGNPVQIVKNYIMILNGFAGT